MKVKVEKIARHKKGFASDGTWYNFFRDDEPAQLPRNIKEGSFITLTEYEEEGDNYKFSGYEAGKPSPSSSSDKGDYSKGGESPNKQRNIARQNALTNAVAYASGRDLSPDEVIAIMNKFASAVLEEGVEKPGAEAKKAPVKKAPARRKKVEPEPEEVLEGPYDDMDDEE